MNMEDSYEGAVRRLRRLGHGAADLAPKPPTAAEKLAEAESRMSELEELATLACEENESLKRELAFAREQLERNRRQIAMLQETIAGPDEYSYRPPRSRGGFFWFFTIVILGGGIAASVMLHPWEHLRIQWGSAAIFGPAPAPAPVEVTPPPAAPVVTAPAPTPTPPPAANANAPATATAPAATPAPSAPAPTPAVAAPKPEPVIPKAEPTIPKAEPTIPKAEPVEAKPEKRAHHHHERAAAPKHRPVAKPHKEKPAASSPAHATDGDDPLGGLSL
jgi:hypothetical protein